MRNLKLFIALSTFGEYGNDPLDILRECDISYSINPLKRRLQGDEIIELARGFDGIIAGVEIYDEKILDNLPGLRCISRCGVGIDNIDSKKADLLKITILNTPEVVIRPVVELTIGMIFDLLRKISLHTALMKAARWEKSAGNLLIGKKVGIIGLGRIGKKVAELLCALGADVYATDPFFDSDWARSCKIKNVPLDELLRISDIISIHLSQIHSHPFCLGKKEINSMKRGVYIVNVARGGFIDESALYDALTEQHIAGVALDVFPEEPYRGKLCGLDNVVLTPHIGTLTIESRVQMETEATQNIINFFKNSGQY